MATPTLSQLIEQLINAPIKADLHVLFTQSLVLESPYLDSAGRNYGPNFQSMEIDIQPGTLNYSGEYLPVMTQPNYSLNPGSVAIHYYSGTNTRVPRMGFRTLDPHEILPYFRMLDPYVQSVAGWYREGSAYGPYTDFGYVYT